MDLAYFYWIKHICRVCLHMSFMSPNKRQNLGACRRPSAAGRPLRAASPTVIDRMKILGVQCFSVLPLKVWLRVCQVLLHVLHTMWMGLSLSNM